MYRNMNWAESAKQEPKKLTDIIAEARKKEPGDDIPDYLREIIENPTTRKSFKQDKSFKNAPLEVQLEAMRYAVALSRAQSMLRAKDVF